MKKMLLFLGLLLSYSCLNSMEQRGTGLIKCDLQDMYEQFVQLGDVESLISLYNDFLVTRAVPQNELDSMIAALSSSQETASHSSALEEMELDIGDYDMPDEYIVTNQETEKENDVLCALRMQYDAACESNDLSMILSLQESLITYGILGAEEFQAVVMSLTPTEPAPVTYSPGSSSSRSVSPEEQARIMQDRAIREETERAYQESLHIDQQREATENLSVQKIQRVWRACNGRKKLRNALVDLRELNRLAQLDECVVELSRSANPQDRSTINRAMDNLGNDVKLTHLFRRIAGPIAQVLNPTADRAELQQSVAIVLSRDDSNQNLANLRAQRIVDCFLR